MEKDHAPRQHHATEEPCKRTDGPRDSGKAVPKNDPRLTHFLRRKQVLCEWLEDLVKMAESPHRGRDRLRVVAHWEKQKASTVLKLQQLLAEMTSFEQRKAYGAAIQLPRSTSSTVGGRLFSHRESTEECEEALGWRESSDESESFESDEASSRWDSRVGSRDSRVGSKDSRVGSGSRWDARVGSRESRMGSSTRRDSRVGSKDSKAGSRTSRVGSWDTSRVGSLESGVASRVGSKESGTPRLGSRGGISRGGSKETRVVSWDLLRTTSRDTPSRVPSSPTGCAGFSRTPCLDRAIRTSPLRSTGSGHSGDRFFNAHTEGHVLLSRATLAEEEADNEKEMLERRNKEQKTELMNLFNQAKEEGFVKVAFIPNSWRSSFTGESHQLRRSSIAVSVKTLSKVRGSVERSLSTFSSTGSDGHVDHRSMFSRGRASLKNGAKFFSKSMMNLVGKAL
mmetsp:Transcript_49135/g.116147  ORF Transcript_49135/g.116147 Transcript_49135/m.116147 type:complete len:452 (+) Transcript_49135:342-1697(+)